MNLRYCVFLFCVVFAVVSCSTGKKPIKVGGAGPPPTAVKVVKAVKGSLREKLTVSGHLRALNKAEVTSRITGRVVRVAVREGMRVKKGQPLAWLEQGALKARLAQAKATLLRSQALVGQAGQKMRLTASEVEIDLKSARDKLRQAEAALAKAKAELEDSEVDFKRQSALFKEGAIPRSVLDKARLRYKLAVQAVAEARAAYRVQNSLLEKAESSRIRNDVSRSQLQAAQEAVRMAQAQLREIDLDLQDTVIRAPIDGVVVERSVEAGAMVGGGKGGVLFKLVDNTLLDFFAYVDEQYAPFLSPQQEVKVYSDLFPDKTFAAKIVSVIPSSDPETHNLGIRILLDGSHKGLVDGLYVKGILSLRTFEGTVIPRNALQIHPRETYVMVRDGAKAFKKTVKVLFSNETKAVVTGIAPGTEVITAGGSTVTEGGRVRVSGDSRR